MVSAQTPPLSLPEDRYRGHTSLPHPVAGAPQIVTRISCHSPRYPILHQQRRPVAAQPRGKVVLDIAVTLQTFPVP